MKLPEIHAGWIAIMLSLVPTALHMQKMRWPENPQSTFMKTPIHILAILLLCSIITAQAQIQIFNSTEFCEIESVVHDDSGNVFYAGAFGGTVDFEPDDGQDAQDTLSTDPDGSAGFIAGYSAAGDFRFVRRLDGLVIDDLATDAAGNLYGVGEFSGFADFDPGPGVVGRTGGEFGDGFVTSYTNTGDFRFAEVLGGLGPIYDLVVTTSAADRVYVAGNFEFQIDIDPTAETDLFTVSGDDDDGFVAAFMTDGTYLFGKQLKGEEATSPSGIAADAAGNFYVCGSFNETADLDGTILTTAGGSDIFLASYSSAGTLRFAHGFGSPIFDVATDVAVDSSGSAYITGLVSGGADFDPGAGVVNSPRTTGYFIAKYTSDGALGFAITEGPVGVVGAAGGSSISTRNGKVFTTGTFEGYVDLAPGDPIGRGVVFSEERVLYVASYNTADGTSNYARSYGVPGRRSSEVSAAPDGSVVVAGTFEGEVDFDPGLGVVSRSSVGSPDSYSLRLDPQGLFPGTSEPVFEVTNTNDSGAGSLRAAIEASNSRPIRNTITFAIPGSGPHVISLESPLPEIESAIVIDGLSQPGASAASWPPDLRVVIDGSAAGEETSGLSIGGNVTNRFLFDPSTSLRGLVLSGFDGYGIVLSELAKNVDVTHCFIGTNPSGNTAVPNGLGGLLVESNDVHVGLPGAGNLISGNGGPGVLIAGEGDNFVQGNFIGTTADGTAPLGNADDGVILDRDFNGRFNDSNVIGGVGAGESNRIAYNAGDGVSIGGALGSDVLGNSIHDNAGLGINLFRLSDRLLGEVNPNDLADSDNGEPNEGTNFPVLRSVIAAGGATHVEGILDGIPGETFRIEFFSNTTIDPSGHGEGKDFLGAIEVETANGPATISAALPLVSPGQFISANSTPLRTARARFSKGGTSEFSMAVPVVTPTVTSLANGGAGSLRAAIEAANASAGTDTIIFSPALAGGQLVLSSDLPTITGGINLIGAPGFVLSGGQSRRPLTIDAIGSTVVISDFTIADGSAPTGGGILISNGEVELDRCVVRDCSATGNGGGIAISEGRLTLTDCRITACTAGENGGGAAHTGGRLFAERVTFDNNTAVNQGGGIFTTGAGMLNTTISTNSASTGGGIFTLAGGTLFASFSTFVMNEASDAGGGVSGDLSPLYSIFSLNTAPIEPDITPLEGAARGLNIVGGDPRIGALRDNGGFVPTHALLTDSPARDARPEPDFTPATSGTDARLAPRVNDTGEQIDFGAFEFFTTRSPADFPQDYARFADSFRAGGPEEDDNGDGINNFAAHFFGIPLFSGGAGVIGGTGSATTTELSADGETLTVSFSSPFSVLGAVPSSEVASDLSNWLPGPEVVEIGSSTIRRFYEVRLPTSSAQNFVRIRVSPEP